MSDTIALEKVVSENINDNSFEMLIKQLKKIDVILSTVDFNVSRILNDCVCEMRKLQTEVLSSFFLNRKFFMNLLSFQRVF
jgi:hypothetical protein